jgi:hypothetical protein
MVTLTRDDIGRELVQAEARLELLELEPLCIPPQRSEDILRESLRHKRYDMVILLSFHLFYFYSPRLNLGVGYHTVCAIDTFELCNSYTILHTQRDVYFREFGLSPYALLEEVTKEALLADHYMKNTGESDLQWTLTNRQFLMKMKG